MKVSLRILEKWKIFIVCLAIMDYIYGHLYSINNSFQKIQYITYKTAILLICCINLCVLWQIFQCYFNYTLGLMFSQAF